MCILLEKNGKKSSKVTLYKKKIWQKKNRCLFNNFILNSFLFMLLKLQQVILLKFYSKIPKVKRKLRSSSLKIDVDRARSKNPLPSNGVKYWHFTKG